MSNSSSGTFDSRYGVVHMSYPGPKADPPYGNVNWYRRPEGDVRLQGPALRSFKEAEIAATPRRLRRKGKILPILITGVGYRSWAAQKDLYDTDHQRYADPDESMHVEALAVDIDMTQSIIRRAKIKYQLKKRGWFYEVDGEPWHASFRLPG